MNILQISISVVLKSVGDESDYSLSPRPMTVTYMDSVSIMLLLITPSKGIETKNNDGV